MFKNIKGMITFYEFINSDYIKKSQEVNLEWVGKRKYFLNCNIRQVLLWKEVVHQLILWTFNKERLLS